MEIVYTKTKVKNGISKNIVWHENGQMMFKFYTDEKYNKLKVAKAWYENGQVLVGDYFNLRKLKPLKNNVGMKMAMVFNIIECPAYG